MAESATRDPRAARARFAAFLAGDERLFRHPTAHPAQDTGFCFCERGMLATLLVLLRAVVFQGVALLPFNGLTCFVLRCGGVRIGRGAYISVGAWFDPLFPQLITIEDGAFIGSGARVYAHEFRRDEFRAGRVTVRQGALIGYHAMIACGVDIGRDATVAAAALVYRDVPDGATVVGNPARVIRMRAAS